MVCLPIGSVFRLTQGHGSKYKNTLIFLEEQLKYNQFMCFQSELCLKVLRNLY